MKYRMMKGFCAVAAASMLAMGGMPVGCVLAETVDVPVSGSASRTVTGNFTVTEEDLATLGYGPVVSVPTSINLALNVSDKAYRGSDSVYAYGVIDTGKKISVTIDTSHAKYGKVYNASEVDCTVEAAGGFTSGLTKQAWSKDECHTNMSLIMGGGNASATGVLSVSVAKKGFLPKGTGAHKTYIPLVIQMKAE